MRIPAPGGSKQRPRAMREVPPSRGWEVQLQDVRRRGAATSRSEQQLRRARVMLTLNEIREALEDTTLLPGWQATAWPHEYEGVWVTIQAPSATEVVPLPPQRD